MKIKVIAYDQESQTEKDFGEIEADSYEQAAAQAQHQFNYPRRLIPVPPASESL